MPDPVHFRPLKEDERRLLADRGCTAADWRSIQVEEGFDPGRLRNARFAGRVRIGRQTGSAAAGGMEMPAGIENASVIHCTIGRDVRIANVGVHLANCAIGDGACIEDVGAIETRPGATFGNGVEVEVLNEGGGREVILFNELSSQFAHLLCLHRYRSDLSEKLAAMARDRAEQVGSDVGSIGRGVLVRSVRQMVDMQVGDGAIVSGAARLVNGTVLSSRDAPTTIGSDVHAEDFIVAEGSSVTGGAVLARTFVGQGCQVGRQFSAENSLFFANCEAFHGEAVCVFAGPYTVTHHKSTLLIAGLFSFYNAGSGTNQSNHMYKLGPVHEGKLERGTKTGSFSYMMWPCRVGPFSVVLGKHTRNFDTADLPFSMIIAGPDGRCTVVPGLNLTTVGTVRDGAKWPTRDRRKGDIRRDRISFDVLSPYTVGRMLRGSAILGELQERTAKQLETVSINGAEVKRALLRTGQRSYRNGIELYLLEKVVERAEAAAGRSAGLADAFAAGEGAVYSADWLDIGGQLMPRKRLEDLVGAVTDGAITKIEDFHAELDGIAAAYGKDEWVWVRNTYAQVFGRDLDGVSEEEMVGIAGSFLAAKTRFFKHVLADAQKEFGKMSRTGFGHDGGEGDADADFAQVRGTYEDNRFVRQIQEDLAALEQRIGAFTRKRAVV